MRDCAMDRDGETALRGRGETERGRASLIRRANVVFGCSGINCTVTPGSGPIASTDNAVSCTSSLGGGGGGEVAESELFADGIDIFAVSENFSKRQVETLPQSNLSPAWSLVLVS